VAACAQWLPGCKSARNAQAQRADAALQLADEAQEAAAKGDARRAQYLLAAAVEVNPADCESRRALSELLSEHGSFEAAAVHLRQLISRNPEDPRNHVALAEILYAEGRWESARTLIEQALEMDPRNIQGLVLLARLERQGNQVDRAITTYFEVLAVDPSNAQARLQLADLFLSAGRAEQAAPLLRQVVEDADACPADHRAGWKLLGTSYARQQRWTEAIDALQRAIPLADRPVEELCQLAHAWEQTGNLPEAHAAWRKAQSIAPADDRVVALGRRLEGLHARHALRASP
jgi:Flp pilus assembly protein TadD